MTSIKILIDRSAPEFGGWKVVEKRRGEWVTAFRGTMDECHDWAQRAIQADRDFAMEGR